MNEHYFSESPTAKSERRTISFKIRDLECKLATDAGMFSPMQVDRGTVTLCNATIPPPTDGPLLDLGCGYGPVAIALANRFPDRTIWGVDVNTRALALAKENAESLGLTNTHFVQPDEVPDDVTFAAMYSNPPIKVGKKELHAMMNLWLPRISDDGAAFMVVHKHLGSDSFAKWLSENEISGHNYDVARILSSSGYRVLRAKPCLRAS